MPSISQSSELILMDLGMLLKLVGLVNLIFISFCPIKIQGKGPLNSGFVVGAGWVEGRGEGGREQKQKTNKEKQQCPNSLVICLHSDIYRQTSFKLGVMISLLNSTFW